MEPAGEGKVSEYERHDGRREETRRKQGREEWERQNKKRGKGDRGAGRTDRHTREGSHGSSRRCPLSCLL